MEHSLEHTWVLWEHASVNDNNNSNWLSNMRKVCEFSSVEEFWKHWLFIPKPSCILFDGQTRKEVAGRTIEAFSIFKKGIRPEWEDVANKNGSEFVARDSFTLDQLDLYWENLVLSLIGGIMDNEDKVCGCRVVDKSPKNKNSHLTVYKIELWLRSVNVDIANNIKIQMLDIIACDGDNKASKPNCIVKMPEFKYNLRR
jgi:hypothetical protein